VLAGEVTVQPWSAQIEKTKTRRHTLNVQQMNLLLGIGAMGLTSRGWNQRTVHPPGHSQRTQGATDRLNLRSVAPVLDLTTGHKWADGPHDYCPVAPRCPTLRLD